MCVMFGYTKEELMERNIKIIMTHPHSEMHDTYLKRYFRTHKKRIIGTTRTLKARHRVSNCTATPSIVAAHLFQ
jgi:two-component system sensor kinase FixL